MLNRKISSQIESFLQSGQNKMLIVEGARQIGKSYIVRYVGQRMFANYIEINMEEDKLRDRLFADVKTVDDFYLALSVIAGNRMKDRDNTLVFIDEIQAYPELLTLAKFLVADARYTYIASGSMLGVTLRKVQSIPVGSIVMLRMYPLDFEEFLWANNVGKEAIEAMLFAYSRREELPEALHDKMMDLFRKYLLVGGLPDAVNTYLKEHNVMSVRSVHRSIMNLYVGDAAKYEAEAMRKLKIRRIYEMVPSNLESRKKRIVVKDIEGKTGKRTSDYQDEFDYLVASGVALEADAISKPSYPLIQNAGKNLLKLYLNDVGLFTGVLYQHNIKAVMDDVRSINLGSVYETVVAQELSAHAHRLFYYDNKKVGEVDFLVNDAKNLSVLPIEVKSGKDYKTHSALDRFLSVKEYNIRHAYVLSNERRVVEDGGIIYLPIYYIMFVRPDEAGSDGTF